jgi:YidC/Oxa1 family membrane protein insertase
MLTVVVRAAMWPLSRKAARNAAMMQHLAPELKRISEKHKTDMEKRVQAQRELYKKYNFNPFGGCLLMFVQLPIFIGLYRCLSVDIELRQAPLIPGMKWASNLAGPDMLWRWPLPRFLANETGWLGPYLNILPVVTIALFIIQQKLFTPPATDDQTRMQQKIMQIMMVVIGVMFFKVPSGLCIYFIASSVWGIAERLLLPKPTLPDEKKVSEASTARVGGHSGNGTGSREKRRQPKKK